MTERQAIEGRWNIWLSPSGIYIEPDDVYTHAVAGSSLNDYTVPVVPCDDAAVQRVADELRSMLGDVQLDFRELAEMALRAASGPDPG